MATNDNIKNFTALDIEKYHRGLLSPQQRHAMEKAALDDPFLADALEGYAVEGVNATADISELKKRLAEKVDGTRVIPVKKGGSGSFPWLRAAAAVVIIGGAALLAYQFVFTGKNENIAQAPVKKEETGAASTTTDTVAAADKVNNAAAEQNVVVANKDIPGNNQTVTLNGGNGRMTDTSNNAEISAKKMQLTNQPVATTDDKSTETAAIEKTKSQPAGIAAKEKNEEAVAATPKKDADADGVADKIDQSKRNELAKNRAVTTDKKLQGITNRYQPNVFRGRVVDNNNNGIPFVNVTNVQDNVGTYTDARGYFNLTSPDSVLQVQTRALGFNSNNIELRNNIPSNQVVLEEDRALAAQILSTKRVNTERRTANPSFKLEGEPEPEDGWDNYDSYLANNLNIPLDFKTKQTAPTGLVEVSFEVNRNGEPINFKVERSLCSKCDQEAIRLIKEGPKWKQKARKKRTTVAIPFENY